MQSVFSDIRNAGRRVFDACEQLNIAPGMVRFVFWSSRLQGEVTNSGNAGIDIERLMSIPFGGKSSFGKIEVPIP